MDTLLTILKPICQTGMNLSLKKCLVSILQAMIVSWSVNILKLASEFTSRADVSSVARRIERFLLRGLVKQHEAARSIINTLPRKTAIYIEYERHIVETRKIQILCPGRGNLFQRNIAADMFCFSSGS